jgi:hypothetical protein
LPENGIEPEAPDADRSATAIAIPLYEAVFKAPKVFDASVDVFPGL